MEFEKKLEQKSNEIQLLCTIATTLQFFVLILVITLFFIPRAFPEELRVWLVTVSGCSVVGILVVLFLVRRNSTAKLWITFLSVFVSGLLIGTSIFAIHGLA